MDLKLELIVIPVSDVDVAKDFYVNTLGFSVEMDQQFNPDFRVARLIPPGSRCAIAIGTGLSDAVPGTTKGMHLMVLDATEVASDFAHRGVAVNGPYHFVDAVQVSGLHPTREPFNTFLDFADPDGNAWIIQEVPAEN
jgi:catechol 2,3-dioxygenase-like lactoylglutathione lyase family enzyme